jgi:L-lactate dehydrogenase complex protein LldE
MPPASEAQAPRHSPGEGRRVALFVTCLVDLFRPSVGFAAVKLIEQAGFIVEVPEAQTCCGQPAYNSGDRADTQAIARNTIAAFEGYDYIVAPSGSCGGMLHCHYPELLAEDPAWAARAVAFAARSYELTQFLAEVAKLRIDAAFPARVAYHDSCSSLREMGVKRQPRDLLGQVKGVELAELAETEACCGFGGTFCVKFPDISNKMVERKTADIAASGADTLLAGDLGCLMNIAGKLKREGSSVKVRHVAEVLAGMTATAAIGETE